MAGIGNVQLGVRLTRDDVHNQRIARTATGQGTAKGGFLWDPTTRYILKREETDKQNDDNLTFLFEYRALLNSRVQTLITQLSNALASDLDVAMNAENDRWGTAPKPGMTGNSTNLYQDAGAARATYNYLMGWFTTDDVTNAERDAAFIGTPVRPNTTPPANYPDNLPRVSPSTGFDAVFTGNANTTGLEVTGTAAIVTARGGVKVDTLIMDGLTGAKPTFTYANTSSAAYNRLDDSFSGPLGQAAIAANAKNLFEKVLFDALSSVEYRPVLSSGLFKNLVVSASSSLPTGSQIQASFNLSYQGTQNGGELTITTDKITAYYSS